ncbi:hypothetical protein LTR10_005307 [Elasticomyces elasticus]|nr:hypothetical protein LTR10_005307 [Elasticomyces elasticus]KAK4976043.1 hypothetical protein LTR42_003668 [Elasticomyces elasticus]
MPVRMKDYAATVKPTRSATHQGAHLAADDEQSMLLCDLEPAAHVVFLAEQVTFLMIGCYVDQFYRSVGGSTSSATTSDPEVAMNVAATDVALAASAEVSEEEKDLLDDVTVNADDEDPDGGDEDEDSVEALARRRGAKYSVMKSTACALISIANEVFKKVGWVPLIERTSFVGTYGTLKGLNVTSPLALSFSKPVWSAVFVPSQNVTIYRRIVTLLRDGRQSATPNSGFYISLRHAGMKGRMQFSVTRAMLGSHAPSAGDRIHLVFEVTHGRRHPQSLANLPTVNLYDDDTRASTLGLRLEWPWPSTQGKATGEAGPAFTDGPDNVLFAAPPGADVADAAPEPAPLVTDEKKPEPDTTGAVEWFGCYIPDSHDPFRSHATDPGALSNLSKSIAVLNMLERCVLRNDVARSFDRILSAPRIIEVSFDNLTQTVRIAEDSAPLRIVIPGAKRTLAVMQQAMTAAGAARVSPSGPQHFPRPVSGKGSARNKCDRHFLIQAATKVDVNTGDVRTNCVYPDLENPDDPQADSCELCALYGPPCTWTPSDQLVVNTRLLHAIWAPGLRTTAKYKEMPLSDPMLETSKEMIGGRGELVAGEDAGNTGGKAPTNTQAGTEQAEDTEPSMPVPPIDQAKVQAMYQVKGLAGSRALFEYFATTASSYSDLAKPDGLNAAFELTRYNLSLAKALEKFERVQAEGKPVMNIEGWKQLFLDAQQAMGEIDLDFTSPMFRDEEGKAVKNRFPSLDEMARFKKRVLQKNRGHVEGMAQYVKKLGIIYRLDEDTANAMADVMRSEE